MSIEAAGDVIIVELLRPCSATMPPDSRPSRGTVVSFGPDVKGRVRVGDRVVFDDCDGYDVGEGLVAFGQCYLLAVEFDGVRDAIFDEIDTERAYQDSKWGGKKMDDGHSDEDWLGWIAEWSQGTGRATAHDFRTRMLKTAAMAVAAVESVDRKCR